MRGSVGENLNGLLAVCRGEAFQGLIGNRRLAGPDAPGTTPATLPLCADALLPPLVVVSVSSGAPRLPPGRLTVITIVTAAPQAVLVACSGLQERGRGAPMVAPLRAAPAAAVCLESSASHAVLCCRGIARGLLWQDPGGAAPAAAGHSASLVGKETGCGSNREESGKVRSLLKRLHEPGKGSLYGERG